jgi:penicillin V acylase-like amidase (Ntn superfamily)
MFRHRAESPTTAGQRSCPFHKRRSRAVDDINDAGLVAALLSDDESTTGGSTGSGGEPTCAPAVGLHEVEVCRYVLERCADVDEALDAMWLAKHYYFFHPQHFLIADRSGRSFVFEISRAATLSASHGVTIAGRHQSVADALSVRGGPADRR